MSSEAMNFVKQAISENAVTVFSKTFCPYCAKAKSALNSLSVKNMSVIELDKRSDGDSIQNALQELTGGRSVPRVFIQGKFIGGGDDVCKIICLL